MIIKSEEKIKPTIPEAPGIKDVTKKILIGTEDGSHNIVMRRFVVNPGGNTPRHTHDFEHIVNIEKGEGIAVDDQGNRHKISAGQSLYIKPNEKHQFTNPYSAPFQFLCIIPNIQKKG